MFLNNTFFAQVTLEENRIPSLNEIPYQPLIIVLVLSFGVLAIILALVPQHIRQRIPFIAILIGFLGYFLLAWSFSWSNAPWFIPFMPGIIGTILVLLLITEFINIQFIWGFCAGLYSFILVTFLILFLQRMYGIYEIAFGVIFLSVITATIIYWSFIQKKMKNHFDNFQISLTMIGTGWIGIALGLMLTTLTGS